MDNQYPTRDIDYYTDYLPVGKALEKCLEEDSFEWLLVVILTLLIYFPLSIFLYLVYPLAPLQASHYLSVKKILLYICILLLCIDHKPL